MTYRPDSDQYGPNLSVQWEITLKSDGFTETVNLSRPQIRTMGTLIAGDPIAFLASNEQLAEDLKKEFVSKKYFLDESVWKRETLIQLAGSSYFGAVTKTHTARMLIGRTLATTRTLALLLCITLLMGRLYTHRLAKAHHKSMRAGICPSCAYQYDRRISQICPECGIHLDRESKLIDLLYTRGYRGLKRFKELDDAGSWD